MRNFGARRFINARVMQLTPVFFGLMLAISVGNAQADPKSSKAYSAGVVATSRLQVMANRGNTRAQTMLGFAYETGQGVPQNFVVAAQWYSRAAMRGNATAQYLLGLMYDKGLGVPQDTIIAQEWFILAVAGASGRERDYYTRIRDAVASKMDPSEIAEAQFLAYQWTAAHKR